MITRRQRRRRQALSAYVRIEMEEALAAAAQDVPSAEPPSAPVAQLDEPDQADADAPAA